MAKSMLVEISFILMIIQTIFNAYSQDINDNRSEQEQIEQEFNLFCREVQMILLSEENARRMLKDEKIQLKDVLDMSLYWWTSSLIFTKESFWSEFYDEENKITYEDEFLMRTGSKNRPTFQPPKPKPPGDPVLPPEIELSKGSPADMIEKPKTIWGSKLPPVEKKLLECGEWEYYKPRWWPVAASVVYPTLAYNILSYSLYTREVFEFNILSHSLYTREVSELSPEYQKWEWMDCAASWQKPDPPENGIWWVTEDQWSSELNRWYEKPSSVERLKWATHGRYVLLGINLLHLLRAFSHKDKVYPKEKRDK